VFVVVARHTTTCSGSYYVYSFGYISCYFLFLFDRFQGPKWPRVRRSSGAFLILVPVVASMCDYVLLFSRTEKMADEVPSLGTGTRTSLTARASRTYAWPSSEIGWKPSVKFLGVFPRLFHFCRLMFFFCFFFVFKRVMTNWVSFGRW
jgi:hypothetical protein